MYTPEFVISRVKWLAINQPNTLSMSIFDCHIEGLHSIVLNTNSCGDLTRVYLSDNCEAMKRNEGVKNNPLGIHDHLYHLHLYLVSGEVYNLNYTVDESDFKDVLECSIVNKYSFCGRKPHPKGIASLWESYTKELTKEGLILHKDSLHTVKVVSPKASWLVIEGQQTKAATSLYTNLPINLDSHYRKEDNDFIVSYVESFYAK